MKRAANNPNTQKTGGEDELDGNVSSCIGKDKNKSLIDGNRKTETKTDDEFYRMNYEYNGYLLIFAHEYFQFDEFSERPKAGKDIEMLEKSFGRLNFEVSVKRNKTLSEIQEIIEEESKKDFSKYATFAVAISSHGSSDSIAALDAKYNIEEIIKPFKKIPSLHCKPKMFFFGCCRNKLVDNGVSTLQDRILHNDGCQLDEHTINEETDVLIVYATLDGYISYHNDKNGTPFFICLADALNDYADTTDMLTILTKANQQLSSFSTTNSDREKNNKKQCMCFLSTLRKIIKFKMKSEEQK